VSPADRYARLRESAFLREGSGHAEAGQWSEHELQALWFAGAFGREFTTTDGHAARVVQFGVWNHEAGPDFAETAVAFDGGTPRRGCIELDTESADWERHGHATNADYDGVVLHVFVSGGKREFFTRTSQHRSVPQVQLDLRAIEEPPNPQPAAKPGRCVAPLRALPVEKVREVLLGAAQFRLRRKAAAIARLSELHGDDEALYQSLAATLGYKSNKLPFTLLSQRLPLRLLRNEKESAAALLFGVAGFLDQRDLGEFDSPTRVYLRGLWERWWPRRADVERLILPRSVWKMSGQRPMNHPQRRLAALAQIIRHWPRIRALREACLPDAITEFFGELRDEYWERMFTQICCALSGRCLRISFQKIVQSKNTIKNTSTEIHRCSGVSLTCISMTAEKRATRMFSRSSSSRKKFLVPAVRAGRSQNSSSRHAKNAEFRATNVHRCSPMSLMSTRPKFDRFPAGS
jgi:hypothetical protein